MKARSQRTHHMGGSNRDQNNFDSNFKTQNIFDRSYHKSKSLYGQTDASKFLEISSALKHMESADTRVKPFLGTHNQFQSKRFDKNHKRQYRPSKMVLAPTQKIFDLANNLNKQVKEIQEQFKDKRINMHKLKELKRTFVKNNRQKRNMKPYFNNFCNEDGMIDFQGMKKLVKQYGFDVNNEEIQLIFKMSNRHNKNKKQNKYLPIDGFVELMTKDDIFYNTLKIGDSGDVTFGEKTKHFAENIHQVLRNKFPKLKEAFKIYRSREQNIDFQRYSYVMKKMDLTNLVIPEQQRYRIFDKYSSEDGQFNVQRFIGDIAQQQYGKQIRIPSNIDFSDNLRTNEQKNQNLQKKVRNNSLKNMSALEYEKQLQRASNVINQLKELLKNQKNPQQKKQKLTAIVNGNIASRSQVSHQIQNFMKTNGLNFQKDDYDAFVAYLDFDVKGQISNQRIFKNIFQQNQKQAQDRFQRKLRNQPPKSKIKQSDMIDYTDDKTAIKCIRKIKDHKMNPQNRELFNYFDQDKDGYIASEQLTQKLEKMNILQKWQINALSKYLDPQSKGAIDFQQFTQKLNKELGPKELPFVKTSNSRSFSEWKDTNSFMSSKRNFIKTMNQPAYQRPSQFSAWPERLKHSDLSMIQPASNTGLFASDNDRFNERKEDYALKQKMIANSIKENKIKKLALWNEKNEKNIQLGRQKQEDRQAARNYTLRITQQKYEENCHRKY